MGLRTTIKDALVSGPWDEWGHDDPTSGYSSERNEHNPSVVKKGVVEQFNVGMYSALVSVDGEDKPYICFTGTLNVCPGFGYSDDTVLREGDQVLFAVLHEDRMEGVILARKPIEWSQDDTHQVKTQSDTRLERRTHFFSSDCYRKKSPAYDNPLTDPTDMSTGRYLCNRPTDLVPGETGMLNPHRCGYIMGMYSASLVGGGAHVRLFALENRIRVVADSIVRYTLSGNDVEWHNRRYLSKERASCMYQEERLGMKSTLDPAFTKSDYDNDGYFIKNKKEKQTARPRILEHDGYFGGISAKYVFRPDPDSEEPRTMDEQVKEAGVLRESVDPSGQYRLASAGMLGLERIGRIPVPVRNMYPWQKEADEPPAEQLEEFKHSGTSEYYRQLEHADRVAYDLKNSYSRLDESKKEFYVPNEQDLEGKVQDVYDPGFTKSRTVKLQKYDKRRSGIWQGEDGSIIIRDAWGSEIVMIGGNIQLSCPGNVEVLPGKSSLIMAGDDAIVKAQNSVDVESADRDVRINAFKNVQVLAGADDEHPGGVTIEAVGKAGPWDAEKPEGGEQVQSTGILLKSHNGNVVTDTKNLLLRAVKKVGIVAGDEKIAGGKGRVDISADDICSNSKRTYAGAGRSELMLTDGNAVLAGESTLVTGVDSVGIFKGNEVLVPLMWVSGDTDVASEVLDDINPISKYMTDEKKVMLGYTTEFLAKMFFKFRSTVECDTKTAWELQSGRPFTLFQPFWHQVMRKFETLKSIGSKSFDDHRELWGAPRGHPWPGTDAVSEGKFAKLSGGSPVNMDDDGFNKPRKAVQDKSPVTEVDLFPGYQIRAN